MSVNVKQLSGYIDRVELKAQTTDAEAITGRNNSKNGQTKSAVALTKTVLNQFIRTVSDQHERTLLMELQSAVDSVPSSINPKAIYNLFTGLAKTQGSILIKIKQWLSLDKNSSGNPELILLTVKTIHFILLTLRDDIQYGEPGNKTILRMTILTVKQKNELYPKINRLIEQCKTKSLIPRKYKNHAEKIKRLQSRGNHLLESNDSDFAKDLNRLQKSLMKAKQELNGRIQELVARKNKLARLNSLYKAIIYRGDNVGTIWQCYKNKNYFLELLNTLDLSPSEKDQWLQGYDQYHRITYTDAFFNWSKWALSPLYRCTPLVPISQIYSQLNACVNAQYAQACREDKQQPDEMQTTKEKLQVTIQITDYHLASLPKARDDIHSLIEDLQTKDYNYIRTQLREFVRLPNLIAYVTSSAYRECYQRMRPFSSQFNPKFSNSKTFIIETFQKFHTNMSRNNFFASRAYKRRIGLITHLKLTPVESAESEEKSADLNP